MANQAVRVPEPSVESSSVRCPLGCDYGALLAPLASLLS